jgi:hypothetical protein
MAKKASLKTISSGFASNTQLNSNFEALNTKLDNTLSLDGSTPNSMGADLDMNGNDIINTGNFDVDTLTVDGSTVQDAITAAAGNVRTIYWEGAYNGATAYTVNDGVSYNGSSYVCILDSTGNLPTDATYWQVFAAAGADGAGSGDMTAATYDPTSVTGDAFDMGNMAESATAKVMSDTERTKLAGIESGADVTDETNVVAALSGATITGVTKADTDQVLILDASDSNNLKQVSMSTIGGGPSLGENSMIRTNGKTISADIVMWENNMTATVDAGADTVDKGTDDAFADGDEVRFETTGAMPAGLAIATAYYVRDITATTMKLAATIDGAAIDITDTGSGTHTIYKPVNGVSVGPITAASGVTVTGKSGSTWRIV